MATLIFITGIIGGIILVFGAAWPDPAAKKTPVKPYKSVKNWLLAAGGLILFLYAILNFTAGGPVFFIFLQTLIVIASIMMMLDTDDRIDMAVISTAGVILVIWSLTLFEGYNTILFIIGLSAMGLGYTLKSGTLQRNIALTSGAALIAIFSFIESNWIYFGLNTFFAVFSGYYLIRTLQKSVKNRHQQ